MTDTKTTKTTAKKCQKEKRKKMFRFRPALSEHELTFQII